jgi:hypothetical protein
VVDENECEVLRRSRRLDIEVDEEMYHRAWMAIYLDATKSETRGSWNLDGTLYAFGFIKSVMT